jgi:hypothetical protein
MPEQNVAHDIEINEWEQPLPDFARVATRYPHYQLDLTADYRAYWRTTGNHKRLKAAAPRTQKLQFEVDTPGIAAWTIGTWSERWGEHLAASDQLLAAAYHARANRLHAFGLFDQGVQCAGIVAYADADCLIFVLTARLFAYDPMGVGNRLLELSIDWARAHGFKTFDFRSGRVDSYKRWWSPAVGDAWSFRIRPASMHALKQSRAALSSTLGIAIGH